MGIVLDLMLIVFLILVIYGGYKKGLISVVFKIVSFIIALVIALIFATPVTNYIIENTSVNDKIESAIIKNITGEDVIDNVDLQDVVINEENLEKVPKPIAQYVLDSAKEAAKDTAKNTAIVFAEKVSRTIIHVIVTIIIFIVAKILLVFARVIIEGIAELPIIKQFDKLGGTIYGAIKGIFIICLFFAIVSLIAPIGNVNAFVEVINVSILGKLIYNNNLLIMLLF